MIAIRNPLFSPMRLSLSLPLRLPLPVAGLLAVLLAVFLYGCTQPFDSDSSSEPPPFREIVGTRLLMAGMLDPAVDVVWDAVASIITEDGIEEIQPQTEEEWIAVRNAAIVVGESGNLLMMERRALDNGDWILWALDLVDGGKAAMVAAESQDPQSLFDAGGQIYEACLGCHESYWQPESGNVMPTRP